MRRFVQFLRNPGRPRIKTRHICLGFLLLCGLFGVINYNLLGADREGDGGGTRFVFMCVLMLIGCIFDAVGGRVREFRSQIAARDAKSGSTSGESASPTASNG